MPRTIEEGFRVFESCLTPTVTETEKAKGHRASIEQCLKNNYGMTRFFRTGSFGNGTSVSGYSDTDYFAVLPTGQHKQDSSSNLSSIRNTLSNRFPFTNVSVDCPAVRLDFGNTDWERIEVTPADFKRDYLGYPVYEIADCNGGWMEASPELHNEYVREIDKKLGGKVKPLIRFVKAWKFYNSVPISSFYLELRVAKYCSGESSIVYNIDLKNILKFLNDNNLPAIQDPKGISGLIKPCKTDNHLETALTKVKTAYIRADKAGEAEANNDTKTAFEWWNKLFDYKFPSYYL